MFWRKYDACSQIEDIDTAIVIFEKVLDAHPGYPQASTGLAKTLRKRASSRVQSDLQRRMDYQRAINLLEDTIVNTADNDKALASRLDKCSIVPCY